MFNTKYNNSAQLNNITNNEYRFKLYRNGSTYMMFVDDFSDYFYSNYNTINTTSRLNHDCEFNGTNCLILNINKSYNIWALFLMIFPFLTLFGNVLVIISVFRERALQTVTNYFIVSLAVADLLVAVGVMPFGVYYLVNGEWSLPPMTCDLYIAMDVTCSTSSIFNLVAISIDRYIAVTQPIKYAKHKNNRRVWLTIVLVWLISCAIGAPIVLGQNDTPDRLPDQCLFYNGDYILYSGLMSFYIPCLMMIFLYYSIFKALHKRAKKQKAARKPPTSDNTTGTPAVVIENIQQTRKLVETALVDDRPTNTASGSNEDEESFERSQEVNHGHDVANCHIIANEKSPEFIAAATEDKLMSSIQISRRLTDRNGNNDSGYAASAVEHSTPRHDALILQNPNCIDNKRNGETPEHRNIIKSEELSHMDSGTGSMSFKKDRKACSAQTRFTIYKVNKASKKKREKSSARKERKATKTLAIVLGVFLICWVPFFTCNVWDAICGKLQSDCSPGVTVFILTTWLGYMNSFVNPVIYTIFNPEFRKAFKKIMHVGT